MSPRIRSQRTPLGRPWPFRNPRLAPVVLVLLALGALALSADAAAAQTIEPFHAFLLPELPDTVYAAIGTTVDVPFWVDSSAHHFNAYDLLVGCDPAIVTPDSVLEGSLFVNACPNRWLRVTLTDSTIAVSHVLLCAGVAVNGPGTLCHLRLHADTLGVSPLNFLCDPDRTFYDEGLYVWPSHPTRPRQVNLHPAVVKVFDPTAGVPFDGRRLPIEALRVFPNPSRGDCRLEFDLPLAGDAVLRLVRPDGRILGAWDTPGLPAGQGAIIWSAADRMGGALPRGTYYLQLETTQRVYSGRLTIVRD